MDIKVGRSASLSAFVRKVSIDAKASSSIRSVFYTSVTHVRRGVYSFRYCSCANSYASGHSLEVHVFARFIRSGKGKQSMIRG